ncbi:hypothetical protein ACKWTF_009977 [Chironomus riparius]
MCTLERKEKIITTQNSRKKWVEWYFCVCLFLGNENKTLLKEIFQVRKKSHRDGSIQERNKGGMKRTLVNKKKKYKERVVDYVCIYYVLQPYFLFILEVVKLKLCLCNVNALPLDFKLKFSYFSSLF